MTLAMSRFAPALSKPPKAIEIVYLADVPGKIPTLTDWFVAKWGAYYGFDGPGDARADLRACLKPPLSNSAAGSG